MTPASPSARGSPARCTSPRRRPGSATSTGPRRRPAPLPTAGGELCQGGGADDMLLFGGYKVAPAEIERVLRAVPGVADCAVVSTLDAAGLEQATAYVVAR